MKLYIVDGSLNYTNITSDKAKANKAKANIQFAWIFAELHIPKEYSHVQWIIFYYRFQGISVNKWIILMYF